MKKYNIIICLIISFLLPACNAKRNDIVLDPFSQLEIKETGWNGKGVLEIESTGIDYTGNDETVEKLIDSISYVIKPNKGLENGNVVTIYLTYSEQYKSLCDVSFTRTEYKYTVNKLEDENRSIRTEESTVFDDSTGEETKVMRQTIIIDGIEIPADWNLTEEEKQEYVRYMKELNGTEGEVLPSEAVDEIWNQGESDSKTRRSDTNFYVKDYENNDTKCYKAAFEFGKTSSQEYKIVPIVDDGMTTGYKCVFK